MPRRLFRRGPLVEASAGEPAEAVSAKREDVSDLLRREDVAGLVRALENASPDIVLAASQAIGSLHRHGDDAMRRQTSACGPALLDAFARVRGKYAESPTGMTLGYAGWSVVGVLGEIRAPDAGPLMVSIVNDSSAAKPLRKQAARAWGRIPGGAHAEVLAQLLVHPPRIF